MKQTLVKINEQHYIICDDSEIKTNQWFYSPNLNREQIYGHDNIPKDRSFKKITHSFGVKLEGVINKPLSEAEEAIKNNPSENNEWNIYFDENNKLKLI